MTDTQLQNFQVTEHEPGGDLHFSAQCVDASVAPASTTSVQVFYRGDVYGDGTLDPSGLFIGAIYEPGMADTLAESGLTDHTLSTDGSTVTLATS